MKLEEQKQKQDKKRSRPKLSNEQKRALHNMQTEAKAAGAILKSNGEGGLPPDLVLGVMRRDKYTCKVHGDKGEGKFGGIEVHHKGGIVESDWLSKKGHKNDPNNIVTLCAKAHDEIHNRAREDGTDSSQVTPKADKGTRRDKGLPDAKPDENAP